MTLKKSSISNYIWVIYSIFAMAFSALLFTKMSVNLGFDAGYGLICVPVVLVIGIGVSILTSVLKKFISRNKKTIAINKVVITVVPYAIALILIGVGIWFRIESLNAGAYRLGEYFERSFIDGSPMVRTVHGASQLYYYSLNNLLMIFGNHYEAILVFQIVCQIIAYVCLFFGVKRMMGNIPAISMLAFAMLSTTSITQCLTLGPSVLYLLVAGLEVLLFAFSVPFRKMSYIFAIITGALGGLLLFMDVTFSVIIIFVAGFLLVSNIEEDSKNSSNSNNEYRPSKYVKDKNKTKESKIKQYFRKKIKPLSVAEVAILQDKTVAVIIFAGACLFVLFICAVIDMSVSGLSFSRIINTQFNYYRPGDFSLYQIYEGTDVVSGTILAVILIIGIPVGFTRKKTDQGTIPFLIALIISVMTGFSMISAKMDSYAYIYIALSIIAGETIYGLVMPTEGAVAAVNEEERLAQEEEKQQKLRKTVHKIEDGEMLDNPLPVPEKKRRKKLEYDYFVPDDAEYDV